MSRTSAASYNDTELWEAFDGDHMLNSAEHMDGVEDNFLMMEVEIDEHALPVAQNDDAWGLIDEQDSSTESTESSDTPRTPSEAERQVVMLNFSEVTHQVTPDQQVPNKLVYPDLTELQIKYLRTLKNLARSMKRSDETRTIVLRQRMQSAELQDEGGSDFFSSPQLEEVEESRQNLYKLINTAVDQRF